MAAPFIRILSDLHYGDRASSLPALGALAPLCAGASRLVLNGDSLDTRPNPQPARVAAQRAEVLDFFGRQCPSVTFLTGNHDPDLSAQHHVELGGGVLVTHGDVLFEDLVPWSQDAALAGRLVARELATLSATEGEDLHCRLVACRRAAALIPQRHQAEPRGLKYLVGFARDTIWPPSRVLRVIRAWRETPARADVLAERHAPRMRFLAMGHTHRVGVLRTPQGRIVLNTGSFCPPGGAGVIDVTPTHIALRRVERRRGAWRLGATIAEFALAER